MKLRQVEDDFAAYVDNSSQLTAKRREFFDWLNQLRVNGELEQYTFKFFEGYAWPDLPS